MDRGGWAAVDEPEKISACLSIRPPLFYCAICHGRGSNSGSRSGTARVAEYIAIQPNGQPNGQPNSQAARPAGQASRYPVLLNPDNANAANNTAHPLSEGATWNSPSSAFLIIIVVITILWATDTISINQSIYLSIYLSIYPFINPSIHPSFTFQFHADLITIITQSIDPFIF